MSVANRRKMSDFVVDTKGHCFLCLRRIPTTSPPLNLKRDEELSLKATTHQSIYSLQYISRYLKMDMGKVFSTNGPISPELLANVQKAKLMAELCEKCESMTGKISRLYKQLEKIEMEMAFYVMEIHQTLVAAETDQLSKSIEADFEGKLEIVNALRNEAANKCADKLAGRIAPKIKVQQQTIRQLHDRMLKFKSRNRPCSGSKPLPLTYSSPSNPVNPLDPMNEADVKLEPGYLTTSMSMEDCDDNYNEAGSIEDSNIDLDNLSISPAVPDVDQQPRVVPATPKSHVNPKTGKHKCKICSKEFSSSGNYRTHHKAVHLKIRYKCSLCSKEFTDQANHSRHFRSEHLGIRFKCKGCPKTFKLKHHLQHHLKCSPCGNK